MDKKIHTKQTKIYSGSGRRSIISVTHFFLTVHALDEVIIFETTLNQVFVDNFIIFIQIHHIVIA
jgi:hypothetical protein